MVTDLLRIILPFRCQSDPWSKYIKNFKNNPLKTFAHLQWSV
nr:MAG TPA: hypothetical protein [Caudoviricetes sp.]